MKAKRHAAAAVIAASVFLSPTAASAACAQSNLSGTWRVHISLVSFQFHCTFVVATNAALTAQRQCILSAAGSRYTLQTGGKLTMSTPSTCTFTGTFTLNGGVAAGQKIVTIKDGVLSKNFEVGAAVGTFAGDGATFDLTRQ